MKFLAWDTSSKSGSVVAFSENQVLAELSLNVEATHSERLLWAIHQVLEASRWKIEEVDAFGVGIGPGSFTGLRIGVTTARTLAHSLGKPLVPVSSLAALARPVAEVYATSVEPVRVIAVTDACKGEVFAIWGPASGVKNCVVLSDSLALTLWSAEVQCKVITPKELADQLSQFSTPWVTVGEGGERYPEIWSGMRGSRLDNPLVLPNQVQGRYLAALVREGQAAHKQRNALEVYPQYLRASDAELKLNAGLLPKQALGSTP